MTEQERYESIDLPYYEQEIKPLLPRRVLDFHAHIWSRAHWKSVPSRDGSKGGNYMVLDTEYLKEDLLRDARRILPDNEYRAVCFGYPTPAADLERTNRYVAEAVRAGREDAGREDSGGGGTRPERAGPGSASREDARREPWGQDPVGTNRPGQSPLGQGPWIYPLLIAGKGLAGSAELEQSLASGGFYGYKVYLPWHGDDYGDLRVEDMLGPVEMELADRYGLIVLLHVPRAGRLADPEIQAGVRSLSGGYPNARIVLAHCGRCYHPDEMKRAAPALTALANVYLDSSMVMDPLVLQILLEHVPSARLLFATDFPVPAMRGRRVYVLDHWVDLVLAGYPESAYRVQSEKFRASFMVYEIIQAIRRAAERVGLSRRETEAIFCDNGAALLERVRRPDSAG
jgi:hypothetical protein